MSAASDKNRSFECAGWTTLGLTREGRTIEARFFPADSAERVMVIAGVHGSELAGIEVARMLIERLEGGPAPATSVLILPCLFPDNAARARAQSPPAPPGIDSPVGRLTRDAHAPKRADGSPVDPNRNFPPPGEFPDADHPADALGSAIEPENQVLMETIDRFRPGRIATLHCNTWNPELAARMKPGDELPGIFADPTTTGDGAGEIVRRAAAEATRRDAALALAMARRASERGARTPGNWLDSPAPMSDYGTPSAEFTGVSLGRWGPRAIRAGGPHDRPAISLFTFEIAGFHPCAAEPEGPAREKRRRELAAYCDTLAELFLGGG